MRKLKFVLLSLVLIVFIGFSLFFVPVEVNGASNDIDPDLEYFWLSAGLPLSAIDFVDEDGKGIKFYVYSVDLDIPWVVLLSIKNYYFDDGGWINGEYYVFLEDAISIFFADYLYDVFAYYQVTYGYDIIPEWDRMVIYWDVEKQVFDLVKVDSDNWYTPDLEEYTFNIPAESEDFIFISHDLVTGNFAEFLTRQYDFGVSQDSTGALDFTNIQQTLLWVGFRSVLDSGYGLTPMILDSLPSYVSYNIYNTYDRSAYKGAVNVHVIKYRLDFLANYSMLLNDYIYDIVYSIEVVYELEIDYFDEFNHVIYNKGYIIHWYDTSEMQEYELYTPFPSIMDNLLQFQLQKIDNYENGYDDGWDDGWNVGHVGGYYTGYNVGYDLGYNEGLDEGYDQGYGIGHDEGYGAGYTDGYEIGRAETYEQDYEQGYEQGYQDGEKSKIAKNNEIFYNRIAIWIPTAITVVALASIISLLWFKKNEQ